MDDLTAFVSARLDEDGYWANIDGGNARRQRELAAKRAIVGAHISACTADRLPGTEPYLDGYTSATEVALKALAAIWSTHADYDPEWSTDGT